MNNVQIKELEIRNEKLEINKTDGTNVIKED